MKVRFLNINKIFEKKLQKLVILYLKEITNKNKINLEQLENFIYILKKKTNFFFIQQNKIKIGFGSVYFNFNNKKYCYIRDFFIIKKYRKKGIGSLIFKKIITICKKKKIKTIRIDILKTNKKIEIFWKLLGFKKFRKSYIYKIDYASN